MKIVATYTCPYGFWDDSVTANSMKAAMIAFECPNCLYFNNKCQYLVCDEEASGDISHLKTKQRGAVYEQTVRDVYDYVLELRAFGISFKNIAAHLKENKIAYIPTEGLRKYFIRITEEREAK